MTAEANVTFTITDPDDLIAGTSIVAPFVVVSALLYRYASEASARADTNGIGGTLVHTFTLVAASTAVSDPNIAGPYRWGFYDSAQVASSWYRYLFADATVATVSQLSDPWQATDRLSWAVRDIIPELAVMVGGMLLQGTVDSASATDVFTCNSLFKSTVRSIALYQNWHLMVTYDAGGASAAPEAEDALIASVTAAGVCTLERGLTAQLAAGDKVVISAFAGFTEILAAMNRAREQMLVEREIDIALTAGKNRYPAPPGVKATSDILAVRGIRQDSGTSSDREYEFDLEALPVNVGNRVFIETDSLPGESALMRVRYLSNYRDVEGSFTSMASTTTAPIEWMRAAFGWELAKYLTKADPTVPDFQTFLADAKGEAAEMTGKYSPDVVREIHTTAGGRKALPGPVRIP